MASESKTANRSLALPSTRPDSSNVFEMRLCFASGASNTYRPPLPLPSGPSTHLLSMSPRPTPTADSEDGGVLGHQTRLHPPLAHAPRLPSPSTTRAKHCRMLPTLPLQGPSPPKDPTLQRQRCHFTNFSSSRPASGSVLLSIDLATEARPGTRLMTRSIPHNRLRPACWLRPSV